MRPVLVAALAVAGLAIGWGLRFPVARFTVPAAGPGATQDARPQTPPQQAEPHQAEPQQAEPQQAEPQQAEPQQAEPQQAEPGGGRRTRTAPPLAVELLTAAVLGGLAARIHPGLVLAATCWLAVCGVALAWIDACVQRLPDALTAAAYAGTTALLLAEAAISGNWHSLVRAVVAGLALAAILGAVAVISRSALGLGDAKLAASLGTMLAWFGWLTVARGLAAGVLLGAVYALILLAARRVTRGHRVAFGPFIIAGAFLVILAAGA